MTAWQYLNIKVTAHNIQNIEANVVFLDIIIRPSADRGHSYKRKKRKQDHPFKSYA